MLGIEELPRGHGRHRPTVGRLRIIEVGRLSAQSTFTPAAVRDCRHRRQRPFAAGMLGIEGKPQRRHVATGMLGIEGRSRPDGRPGPSPASTTAAIEVGRLRASGRGPDDRRGPAASTTRPFAGIEERPQRRHVAAGMLGIEGRPASFTGMTNSPRPSRFTWLCPSLAIAAARTASQVLRQHRRRPAALRAGQPRACSASSKSWTSRHHRGWTSQRRTIDVHPQRRRGHARHRGTAGQLHRYDNGPHPSRFTWPCPSLARQPDPSPASTTVARGIEGQPASRGHVRHHRRIGRVGIIEVGRLSGGRSTFTPPARSFADCRHRRQRPFAAALRDSRNGVTSARACSASRDILRGSPGHAHRWRSPRPGRANQHLGLSGAQPKLNATDRR